LLLLFTDSFGIYGAVFGILEAVSYVERDDTTTQRSDPHRRRPKMSLFFATTRRAASSSRVVAGRRRCTAAIVDRTAAVGDRFFSSFSSSYGDAAASSQSSTHHAFDRELKRKQRDNAARACKAWRSRRRRGGGGGGRGGEEEDGANTTASDDDTAVVRYDYFREEIAARLVDRLDDIRRDEGFPLALDVGSGPGYAYRSICSDDAVQEGGGGIGGVRKLVQLDSSSEMLFRDAGVAFDGSDRCDTYRMVADEEGKLPFPDGTFDLVLSGASMHWVNDLPGLFREANRVLKPDGCFLFAMVGGTTLPELRASMVMAELERDGGVSPHVGPFVQLSDIGNLLQRAGFALPTLDVDTVKLAFPNAAVLMEHLQRMGENNACIKRRDRASLDVLLATACIYDEMFRCALVGGGTEGNDDSGSEIEASVEVIYAIGWTPHESQQQPLERGTATHKVGEVVVDGPPPS